MKLISWNVNGLRSILEKTFDALIQCEDPDIICLQEIKVNPDTLPEIGFPQYGFRSFNCADRRGYSGTATLAKKAPRSVDENIHLEKLLPSHEGRVQVVDFFEFFVVNAYVPNAQRELTRLPLRKLYWDKNFGEYLAELAEKKPLIACGDFNVAHRPIDLARPAENRGNAGFTDEEREGFSSILDCNFVDVFRFLHPEQKDAYSWWSYRRDARVRNIGWRIDYVLATPNLLPSIGRCEILSDVLGSDHAPLLLEWTNGQI